MGRLPRPVGACGASHSAPIARGRLLGKRLGTPLAAAPGGGVGGMGLESIREKKAWETGCRSMGRLPRPVGALVRATAPRSRGDDFGKGVTPSLFGSHSRRGDGEGQGT
eukprot:scaffold67623_cov29-Phaeocystis_antarctica.AAC.1